MNLRAFLLAGAVLLALALTEVALPALPEKPPAEASGFDVLHYDADLHLDFLQHQLSGEVTLEVQSLVDGLAAISLASEGLTIHEVRTAPNGSPVPFRVEAAENSLLLDLQRAPMKRGEQRRFSIRYRSLARRGVRFDRDQVFTAFHTAGWLPCHDHPGDRATLDLSLTAPSTLRVEATGRLLGSPKEAGGHPVRRHRFRLEIPRPAYLYGFLAAPLNASTEVARGAFGEKVILSLLGRDFSGDELRRIFADTPRMLRFFGQRAGLPYEGNGYTQALLYDAPPQELAGLSLFSTDYGRSVLHDPQEDYLLAHELAHHWWGNRITGATWSEFWLHEGLVSFMVAAYKEDRWGRAAYDRERVLARLRYERALAEEPPRPLVYHGWTRPEEMSGSLTYSRGLLVLHLLRHEVGEQIFWDGLRRFSVAGAKAGAVTSRDLQRALEAAGAEDLGAFFDAWVYGGDMPSVVAEHRIVEGGVEIDLEQRTENPWRLPIQLEVLTTTRRDTHRVVLAQRRQTFRLPLDGDVLSVQVDAGGHLPRPVEHPRSPAMLEQQVTREPSLVDRAGALLALHGACSRSPAESPCNRLDELYAHLASRSPDDLIRRLAQRERQRP
jgi:aminopeptidase N